MTWPKNLMSAVTAAGNLTVRILEVKVNQQSQHEKNPDIDLQALTARNYFRGYKHLVTLQWQNELPDKLQENIYAWMAENNIDKFSHNILRVNGRYGNGDYVLDVLGSDLWFWAFKNERDAMLFALRW